MFYVHTIKTRNNKQMKMSLFFRLHVGTYVTFQRNFVYLELKYLHRTL